ncbi:Protein PAT-9 [Aphelenchoides avenae]|nr:Protein PAT-9 [Aphelenchus avenae]
MASRSPPNCDAFNGCVKSEPLGNAAPERSSPGSTSLDGRISANTPCKVPASSSSSPGVGHYDLSGMGTLFPAEHNGLPASMEAEPIDIKPIIGQAIGQDGSKQQQIGVGRGNGGTRALAADRKRPYPCNLCSSRFGSKMELEEHQNSHTGLKPFQCDICHSRFNRRSTLWNHKRIHSDAKPFVCTVCQMTFKWKNSLKCHKEMHLRKNETTVATDHDIRMLTYATAAKKRLSELGENAKPSPPINTVNNRKRPTRNKNPNAPLQRSISDNGVTDSSASRNANLHLHQHQHLHLALNTNPHPSMAAMGGPSPLAIATGAAGANNARLHSPQLSGSDPLSQLCFGQAHNDFHLRHNHQLNACSLMSGADGHGLDLSETSLDFSHFNANSNLLMQAFCNGGNGEESSLNAFDFRHGPHAASLFSQLDDSSRGMLSSNFFHDIKPEHSPIGGSTAPTLRLPQFLNHNFMNSAISPLSLTQHGSSQMQHAHTHSPAAHFHGQSVHGTSTSTTPTSSGGSTSSDLLAAAVQNNYQQQLDPALLLNPSPTANGVLDYMPSFMSDYMLGGHNGQYHSPTGSSSSSGAENAAAAAAHHNAQQNHHANSVQHSHHNPLADLTPEDIQLIAKSHHW